MTDQPSPSEEQEATPKSESPPEEAPAPAPPPVRSGSDIGFVSDLPLRLSVEMGSARLLVREVLQLGSGSVIELDRMAGEPADLYVNGRLVGKGHVTAVDDRLAIKLTEIGTVSPGRDES